MHLTAAGILFCIFAANVLAGAIAGQALLHDTAAFLLLAATAFCFVVAILRAEHDAHVADHSDNGPIGP